MSECILNKPNRGINNYSTLLKETTDTLYIFINSNCSSFILAYIGFHDMSPVTQDSQNEYNFIF